MKNKKIIFKAMSITLLVGILGLVLYKFKSGDYITDENSAGWILGVIGTIYALVVAFVLVAVWEQFNTLSSAISREAQRIGSIWNFTDYFDDVKVSKEMKVALDDYINNVIDIETHTSASDERVIHPSPKLIAIMKVIDGIKFDDARDESAFKAIIAAYEDLSLVRSERIEYSTERVPTLLKSLLAIISTLFVLFSMFHMFNALEMYLIATTGLTLVVSLAYLIVDDMDNPFTGIWQVSFKAFSDVKEYINNVVHEN